MPELTDSLTDISSSCRKPGHQGAAQNLRSCRWADYSAASPRVRRPPWREMVLNAPPRIWRRSDCRTARPLRAIIRKTQPQLHDWWHLMTSSDTTGLKVA